MSQVIALLAIFVIAGYVMGKKKDRAGEYALKAVPVAVLTYFGIFIGLGHWFS